MIFIHVYLLLKQTFYNGQSIGKFVSVKVFRIWCLSIKAQLAKYYFGGL